MGSASLCVGCRVVRGIAACRTGINPSLGPAAAPSMARRLLQAAMPPTPCWIRWSLLSGACYSSTRIGREEGEAGLSRTSRGRDAACRGPQGAGFAVPACSVPPLTMRDLNAIKGIQQYRRQVTARSQSPLWPYNSRAESRPAE